jgi:hypothetical protein
MLNLVNAITNKKETQNSSLSPTAETTIQNKSETPATASESSKLRNSKAPAAAQSSKRKSKKLKSGSSKLRNSKAPAAAQSSKRKSNATNKKNQENRNSKPASTRTKQATLTEAIGPQEVESENLTAPSKLARRKFKKAANLSISKRNNPGPISSQVRSSDSPSAPAVIGHTNNLNDSDSSISGSIRELEPFASQIIRGSPRRNSTKTRE